MTGKLYKQPDHVLCQTVDNEMVLLNLDTESYYALDEIGLRFWQVLLEVNTLEDALDTLETEYDVDRNTLSRDLTEFASKLHAKGLLRPSGTE